MNHDLITNVVGLSTDGKGVIKCEGKAYFISGCLPGDQVRVELITEGKTHVAQLLQILQPSVQRVSHPCPHAAECQGSLLGSLAYSEQLKQKQELVQRTLSKAVGQINVFPVVASPKPWHYRNRIALRVWSENEQLKLGFQTQARSESGLEIETCKLAEESLDKLLSSVFSLFTECSKGIGDPLRRLQIHQTASGPGMLLIFAGPVDKKLTEKWLEFLSPLQVSGGIWFATGTKAGIVSYTYPILHSEHALFMQTDWLGMKVELHPASFCQTNGGTANLVGEKIRGLGAEKDYRRIWDLYGGFGALGLSAGGAHKPVTVFELSEFSEQTSNELARKIGNTQLKFIQGDLLKTFPPRAKQLTDQDLVILDPPRSGAHPLILKAINNSAAQTVFYLSCNPARLGRDLSILREGGFEAEEIQPFDFFPQTSSIEVFARLCRQ